MSTDDDDFLVKLMGVIIFYLLDYAINFKVQGN